MERELLDGERVLVIRGLLAAEECERLIARSEAAGYQPATLGEEVFPQLRNNARLILDDPDLADLLWQRARTHLPARLGAWQAAGLNPRFRFYRYTAAEAFGPHYDGSIRLGPGQESKLTLMVYLNDVPRGGQTRFYNPGGTVRFEVQPEQGKALVFEHLLLHEGAEVVQGCKYVLRSDVIYQEALAAGGATSGRE